MRKFLPAAALLAVLAACGGAPAPVTIRGTVTPLLSVRDAFAGYDCASRSPAPGAQVAVTAPDGTVIGAGVLGPWRRDTAEVAGLKVYRCDMPFTVTGVPAQQRYGFRVAGMPGTVWESDVTRPVSIG